MIWADLTVNQSRVARCPQEGQKARVSELDGLRAVAIVLVFLCHVSERTFPGGWIGVDLFFVLSGYLITIGMLSEWNRYGGVSLCNFYLRRVLRLAPAFITLVLFVIGLTAILEIQPLEYVVWSVVYSLSYIANYAMAFGIWQWSWRGLGHVWSLAVEEQFYLLWPLCVVLFHPRLGKKVLLLIALLVAGVLLWRTSLVLLGASVPRTFFAFDTRADSLLVGCGLGYMVYYAIWIEKLRSAARCLVLPVMLGFVVLTLYLDWGVRAVHLGGFTVVGVLSALLIIAATAPGPTLMKSVLGLAPFVYLGRISYGVYLYHSPILLVLRPHFGDRPFLFGALAFLITLAAAGASFRYVEQPFLRMRPVERQRRPSLPDDSSRSPVKAKCPSATGEMVHKSAAT